MRAHLKGRRAILGVIYDEVVRNKWAEVFVHDATFSADSVARVLDDDVLRGAESSFDTESKQRDDYGESKCFKGDGKEFTAGPSKVLQILHDGSYVVRMPVSWQGW